MLAPLRSFLKNPEPSLTEAVGVRRGGFVAMFLAQSGVALLLLSILSAVAGRGSAGPLLSQILVVLALLQIPVAALIAHASSRAGGKGAALSATIMAGVMLATPAWFLAFALLVGSGTLYIFLLLAVLVNAYAVGFFLCGQFARAALVVQAPIT